MKIILLGAPGAGKGTQVGKIKEKIALETISTGNILREAIKNETPLGLKIKPYLNEGKLVPDELVIELVKEKLAACEGNVVFDGFPRTVAQAEALDKITTIDAVVSIEVSDEAIVDRMSGRLTCKTCGATFHKIANPPEKQGICDFCKGELGVRDDDKPEVVLHRLQVYHNETEPVKKHYQAKGVLTEVNGDQPIKMITGEILSALKVL